MPRILRSGFTLIELLVVVSIIVLLMGMAMPLVSIAREASRASATRSTMAKLEGALRQFKADYLVYPFQTTYADIEGGETPDNRLAYQLGTDLDPAQRDRILRDMADAAARYAYTLDPNWNDGTRGAFAYLRDEAAITEGGSSAAGAVALNRMAQERVRLRVLSGDVNVPGPLIRNGDGSTRRDLRGTRALPTPFSAQSASTGPGWAVDYLKGEIERRAVDGQRILDAWRRPLVYVCQVAPGCRGSTVFLYRQTSTLWNVDLFDLGPVVRKRLGPELPIDTAFLPEPESLRHSDRRYYAAPGYEAEFELWSAGRDGRFAWMRDDAGNRDNVAPLDYDAGIR